MNKDKISNETSKESLISDKIEASIRLGLKKTKVSSQESAGINLQLPTITEDTIQHEELLDGKSKLKNLVERGRLKALSEKSEFAPKQVSKFSTTSDNLLMTASNEFLKIPKFGMFIMFQRLT